MPLPDTMRAWRVTRLGEPADALSLDDVPVPAPAPGEVLLRVGAVAANFPDVLLCRGQYQVRPELPFIPGIECVGEVVALGDGVAGLAVGDRVVGAKIGVLSEYARAPGIRCLGGARALTDAEASGLTSPTRPRGSPCIAEPPLQPGEWLLVHAAAGGVGAAAVQLGVAAGARVIGVVGIARRRRPWSATPAPRSCSCAGPTTSSAASRQTTGGHGADVVFDPVGGDAFDASTQVHRVRGADRRRRVRGRRDPDRHGGPRAREELLACSACTGGSTRGSVPTSSTVRPPSSCASPRRARSRPVVDHVVPFDRRARGADRARVGLHRRPGRHRRSRS